MAERKEEHSYGPRRTTGVGGYAAGRVSSVPAVESWMRGPAADRFAKIAEKAGKAGYAGAHEAASAFAHRFTVKGGGPFGIRVFTPDTFPPAKQVASDMKKFIRANPISAPAPSASATAAAARKATAAVGRGAAEGTADFVARKIAEGKVGSGTLKGLVAAAKNGARGLGNLLLGAPGARLQQVFIKSPAWGLAFHGALEGSSGAADLVGALSRPENREQLGGRSAWYDYINPLSVKGGVNPDEFQHNLLNSLGRFLSNTFTLGIADWGQGDYDPMSDPDSYAAQAARAAQAVQDIRDEHYRRGRKHVEELSTYVPGSDVGDFIRAASRGAQELRRSADIREKQLPPRAADESYGVAYAREVLGQNRKNADDIETGAIKSVRDAYKDDPAGYRKLIEDKVDREIIPYKFRRAFPDGLTYDPNRRWADAELGKRVSDFRDKLLGDPDSEYAILGWKPKEEK